MVMCEITEITGPVSYRVQMLDGSIVCNQDCLRKRFQKWICSQSLPLRQLKIVTCGLT